MPLTETPPVKMEHKVKQEPNTTEEFTATPARTVTDIEQRKEGGPVTTDVTKTAPKTVTPPEAPPVKAEDEENHEKQVRFGDDQIKKEVDSESNADTEQKSPTRRGRQGSSLHVEQSRGAVLEFKTYRSPPRKRDEEVPSLCSTGSDAPADRGPKSAKPTSSISVDPSKDTTSPLASHEADKSEKGASREAAEEPQSPKRSEQIGSMYEGTLQSPGNYFLSPNPPTPSRGNLRSEGSFEEKKNDDRVDCKQSPRTDRDHIVATPTNFALDYGKQVSESFDTSNVLAWLQSPTAHGLFSPGGLGSVMNTPAGGARTPRTPTVSTSFFFSDVASLPRTEQLSPKPPENEKKPQKSGISNIICISPLASSRNRTAPSGSNTPMNFKDFFASPRERARSMPLLSDTPSKADRLKVPQRSASKDPSLDAVHMAERDLMEDEDLSVLLQLAHNTPRPGERGSGPSVNPVFRSPGRRKEGDDSNLPGLQIPMIGGRDNETKTRLTQKSSRSRDHNDPDSRLGISKDEGSKDGKSAVDKTDSKDDGGKKPAANMPQTNSLYGGVPPSYRADMPHYYPPMPAIPPGAPPGRSGSMRVAVGVPPPQRDGKGSPGRPGPHGPPPYPHEYPHNGMPFPHPPHPGMYPPYGPYGGMGRYPPYGHYPPPPRHMPMYNAQNPPGGAPAKDTAKKTKAKTSKAPATTPAPAKRASPEVESKNPGSNKKAKKSPQKKKNRSPQPETPGERQKSAASIQAVNAASGGKNDRAAALAAAILRGVTMRPSGKWQAQLYFAGKSRYIGVFDTREKAALAYEIAREKLKSGPQEAGALSAKSTENLVNAARKAAFEGVNERVPK